MTTFRRAPPPDGALLSPSFSSAFSARYNLHQMLESPMPSPALPSITPRHGKKPPKPPYLRRVMRWTLPMLKWILGCAIIYWLLSTGFWRSKAAPSLEDVRLEKNFTLVDDGVSLELPMPVMISDKQGAPKWTISLPSHLEYPLKPSEYTRICHHSDDLARRLRHLNSRSGFQQTRASQDYYYVDPNFMDIMEAEGHGLLPAGDDPTTIVSQADVGTKDFLEEGSMIKHTGGKGKICEKSLTYVLETPDAGIGKTLMGLWVAYGLAKREGRAFFIEDDHWSYGKYSDLFKPPAAPLCSPPPPNHRLPCPHQARHLLVSSGNSAWIFGDSFREHFQATSKGNIDHQQQTFAQARTGYEALFHLAEPDAASAAARLSQLDSQLRSKNRLVVGMHIRRGDKHPWEFQYQHSYTPLETFTETAESIIASHFHPGRATRLTNEESKTAAETDSQILLASDDPDVYSLRELANTSRAQSHISLANKAALDAATPTDVPFQDPDNYFKKFVEGNVGWEGGFFPSVYWGLGNPSAGSKAARGLREEREDPPPSELSLKLRQLVARAYLLDLAVLGKSDAVVCGVSSMGCRLLGVMMGWEKGILGGRWRNVDGSYEWRAFEEERPR